MRKRQKAECDEWSQELKDSYALGDQSPPGSDSNEVEEFDDLNPTPAEYMLQKLILLSDLSHQKVPAIPSEPDPLERMELAMGREHNMMAANDDRANLHTNHTSRCGGGTTWLHYRVEYWESPRRVGCGLEPTSFTSTEWARKAATKELHRQEELHKRLEHQQALQRQRAEQLAAKQGQESMEEQARAATECVAKAERGAAIEAAHVEGFNMLKCTHEGCINMTVHGFHLHVAATNERLRKDSALQKKEKRKNMCKKTKTVRVGRNQLASSSTRRSNLEEAERTIHSHYAWVKSQPTPPCGHTLEALKSGFDSHPHVNCYNPITDELKWH
jgi:hypothetical protein